MKIAHKLFNHEFQIICIQLQLDGCVLDSTLSKKHEQSRLFLSVIKMIRSD
jgi:hypothetical protein